MPDAERMEVTFSDGEQRYIPVLTVDKQWVTETVPLEREWGRCVHFFGKPV